MSLQDSGTDRVAGRQPVPGGGALGSVRGFSGGQNLLLILALIGGGFLGYFAYNKTSSSNQPKPLGATPVPVRSTTITNTVATTGTVTGTEQPTLTFQVSGQLAALFVKPGDTVQAGQPIAALDTTTLQLARDQAQAQYNNALNGITSAQNSVTSSEANLTKAQNALSALLTGPPSTQVQLVQTAIDNAQRDLAVAESNFNTLVSHSDLATRQETTALATAQQNYQSALSTYQALIQPPQPLDLQQAQQNVALAQQNYQAAQLRNLQVQVDPTVTYSDRAASQNQVTQAQQAVQSAQSALEKLQQGTDQSTLAAGKSQVDNAASALRSAQTNFNNLISLSDLPKRSETTSFDQAQSSYNTAQANYANTVAPPKPTDVNSAQADIQSAQAGINSSNSSVTQAQGTAQQAEVALRQSQFNLDQGTLKAPFAGIVTTVPVAVGQQVGSGTAVATLYNPDAMEIDASVDETSITQLRVGQQATVTFDAIPGRTFNATLTVVTPSGQTQNGVVVFPIVVNISNNQGLTIPAGLSANITVVTSTTPNVLTVPARDIRRQGASQVIDVDVNGKRATRAVTTGVTNGQLTQITSGVKEGDLVLPPPQNQGQTATFGAAGPGAAPAP